MLNNGCYNGLNLSCKFVYGLVVFTIMISIILFCSSGAFALTKIYPLIGDSKDNYSNNLIPIDPNTLAVTGYSVDYPNGSSTYFNIFNHGNLVETGDLWNMPGRIPYTNCSDFISYNANDYFSIGHSPYPYGTYSPGWEIESPDSQIYMTNIFKAPNDPGFPDGWGKEGSFILGDGMGVGKSLVKIDDNSFLIAGVTTSTNITQYWIRNWPHHINQVFGITSNNPDMKWINLSYKAKAYQKGKNMFVAKIETDAKYVNNLKWFEFYGGGKDEDVKKIIKTSDGNFVVIGSSESNDGDVGKNNGKKDIFLMKIDSNGNILNKKVLGGPGDDIGENAISTPDGGLMLCGTTNSAGGDIPTSYTGSSSAFVAKIDKDFNVEWSKCYSGSKEVHTSAISKINDYEYALCGYTSSPDGDFPTVSGSSVGYDAFICKISAKGDLLWKQVFGGTGDDIAMDVYMDQSNKIFLTGYTNSNNGSFSMNHGGYDIFMISIDYADTILFKLQDVTLLKNSSNVVIRDWQQDSINCINSVQNYSVTVQPSSSTDTNNFDIGGLPKVDNATGFLSFKVNANFEGVIKCTAQIVGTSPTATFSKQESFNINVITDSQPPKLSDSDFNAKVDTIIADLSFASSAQNNIVQQIDKYFEILQDAGSKQILAPSFNKLITTIYQKFPNALKNEEVLLGINDAGAKILEISNTSIMVPYECAQKVGATTYIDTPTALNTTINESLATTNALNKTLRDTQTPLLLDSILVFDASNSAFSKPTSYLELSSEAVKQAFNRGIKDVILKTNHASFCYKNTSIANLGKRIMFEAEDVLNQYQDIDGVSLAKDDLKLYVDGKIVKKFDNKVSVHIPFNYADTANEHLLTVFWKQPDDTVKNMGGFYNSRLKRMYFVTDHFSMFLVTSVNSAFTDLSSVPWATNYIVGMAAKGLLSGKSNTSFEPNEPLLREEFACMIANTLQLNDSTASSNFSDVGLNDWFYTGVSSNAKLKIMNGVSATKFGVGTPIQKQQVATVIGNFLHLHSGVTLTSNPYKYLTFLDTKDIASYAISNVALVVSNSIMLGDSLGYFYPTANMTRVQAAVVLYKTASFNDSQGLPLQDIVQLNSFVDVT